MYIVRLTQEFEVGDEVSKARDVAAGLMNQVMAGVTRAAVEVEYRQSEKGARA